MGSSRRGVPAGALPAKRQRRNGQVDRGYVDRSGTFYLYDGGTPDRGLYCEGPIVEADAGSRSTPNYDGSDSGSSYGGYSSGGGSSYDSGGYSSGSSYGSYGGGSDSSSSGGSSSGE